MLNPIVVSEPVRQRALANGELGRRWLSELPHVVSDLVRKWRLQLGPVLSGGTAGYVVTATDQSDRACVLKVAMTLTGDDRQSFHRAVRAHELAAGRGCAELLAWDTEASAMLLERLGPNLNVLGFGLSELLDTITSTLRSFWRPLNDDEPFPTGAEKALGLARFVVDTWHELKRPCERAVIDRAIAYCDARAAAFDSAKAVLVHGDAHGWNTLKAGASFKFVDPEGLRSEPAHDLAVPMREYNVPLLAGDTRRLAWERANRLAGTCGVDVEPVWQWGYIERVSTGLVGLRYLDGAEGLAMLAVAQRCL